MQNLTDLDFGVWRLDTASGSTHIVEVRADGHSTVTRLPRQTAPATDRDLVADLRRDGETMPLLGILLLKVGVDGAFYLQVRDDSVATLRMTTTILSIRRIDES